MATCSICELKPAKHALKNARHLNGSKVCDDCYKSCDEHEMQGYLFDTPVPKIEFDFDKPLDYEELKGFITTKLNYKSMTEFFIEIDMNPRSAVQTWKKNKKIPFLAQAYIQNKIDTINKVDEVKEVTKFVEITREIPKHTFEKNGITLQKITNIDEIIDMLEKHNIKFDNGS
jgi:hypothetical protein